jgi:endonuclease/exonuclease/phosphatase family metal-dependent hydrolase
VLQAVGNEVYGGRSRPVDVVAIQEVQMQSTTTAAVVSQLNAIYGAGRYDYGRLNGTSLSTNETVGLIYNTQTVSLVDSIGVGTVSSSGAARQPIRYRLRPLELPLGNDFYVYNSHYKASDTASDRSRRNVEATSIRANADALGQGALIIYAGDFNLKTSSEAAYQTLLAAGNGQALDPINRPGNWNGDPAFRDIFTQAPLFTAPSGFVGGGINDRFDFQLLSNEWTDNAGLEYVSNSYHTFGNNGSVPVNGSINDPANTALPGMANRDLAADFLHLVIF